MGEETRKEADEKPVPDSLTILETRVKALEEAMSTHNHQVGPDLIRLIAEEAKKEVLAHLKRQLGAHLAHFLLDGNPE